MRRWGSPKTPCCIPRQAWDCPGGPHPVLVTPGGQKWSLWPPKSQPDREVPGSRPRGTLLSTHELTWDPGDGPPRRGLYLLVMPAARSTHPGEGKGLVSLRGRGLQLGSRGRGLLHLSMHSHLGLIMTAVSAGQCPPQRPPGSSPREAVFPRPHPPPL